MVKNSQAMQAMGDLSLVPGSGRSPGGENGDPLQYSCLGNPVDRGVWRSTVRGVDKASDTTEWVKTTLAKDLSFNYFQNRAPLTPHFEPFKCNLIQ